MRLNQSGFDSRVCVLLSIWTVLIILFFIIYYFPHGARLCTEPLILIDFSPPYCFFSPSTVGCDFMQIRLFEEISSQINYRPVPTGAVGILIKDWRILFILFSPHSHSEFQPEFVSMLKPGKRISNGTYGQGGATGANLGFRSRLLGAVPCSSDGVQMMCHADAF